MLADKGGQFAGAPAEAKTKAGGKRKAIQDLDPFGAVDTAETAVHGDGRARKTGDERMTFAGRNPKTPGDGGPCNDSDHARAQSDDGFVRIAAKIDHAVNGVGDGGVDHGHDQNAEEIKNSRHQDRGFGL